MAAFRSVAELAVECFLKAVGRSPQLQLTEVGLIDSLAALLSGLESRAADKAGAESAIAACGRLDRMLKAGPVHTVIASIQRWAGHVSVLDASTPCRVPQSGLAVRDTVVTRVLGATSDRTCAGFVLATAAPASRRARNPRSQRNARGPQADRRGLPVASYSGTSPGMTHRDQPSVRRRTKPPISPSMRGLFTDGGESVKI